MAHDVFISYAVEDAQVAEKVCRALEDDGVKCWMAPRDVPYGADYEEAIMDAISTSPLLILILSAHSNASQHVKREIQNACAEGSPTQIIPLRTDAVAYSKALRYYLGSSQWLDASTPPLEAHLRRLVQHVRARLKGTGETETGGTNTGTTTGTEPHDKKEEDKKANDQLRDGDGRKPLPVMWMALGAGALLLVAVVAVGVYKASGGVNENGNGGTEDAYASPTPAGRASGAQSDTNVPTPSPTPATTSPSNPTPTSAASPRPTPPHNLNVRPPINSVVGPVNSAPAEVPDSVIQMHVDKRIAGHAQDLSEVEGEVSNGVVTLTGSVRSADWKTTVEMQIRGITGVKKVVNRIKVQ